MKTTFMIIQLVLAIVLSLIVLLEPPRGEGLGAIGGSARLFHVGKEKEKRLDRIIAVLGGIFFVIAGILAWAL